MRTIDPMDDIMLRMAAIVAPLLRPPWYVRAWFWIRSAVSPRGETQQERLARWLDERRTDDRSCGR